MQDLRVSCKRAQAGKDKADLHCTELELELESERAAAAALRQVFPFIHALFFLFCLPWYLPLVPALCTCPWYLPFVPALGTCP